MLVVVSALGDSTETAPDAETSLAGAATPALDLIARRGRAGVADLGAASPWEGFTALLGIAPGAAALGPVEALGAGVPLRAGDLAWRADFVTTDDAGLQDPFGGGVREPEAGALLRAAGEALPGVLLRRLEGHRNLLVAPGDGGAPEFAPTPFEMIGKPPAAGLVEGGILRAWFAAAAAALAPHDVNRVRVDLGENPANALWFHGGGAAVSVPVASALPRTGVVLVGRGAVTTGLARALGATPVVVDGDDDALAAAVIDALRESAFVVVRTESLLAAQARGGPDGKREATSALDARLVRPVLGVLEECGDFAIAVASDGVTDPRTGLYSRAGAPCAVLRSEDGNDGVPRFTESACARSGFHVAPGAGLLSLLGG